MIYTDQVASHPSSVLQTTCSFDARGTMSFDPSDISNYHASLITGDQRLCTDDWEYRATLARKASTMDTRDLFVESVTRSFNPLGFAFRVSHPHNELCHAVDLALGHAIEALEARLRARGTELLARARQESESASSRTEPRPGHVGDRGDGYVHRRGGDRGDRYGDGYGDGRDGRSVTWDSYL